MDFSLNEDQLALREAVRRFCEAEYPAERRGDPESPDLEAKRWQGMSDLGLPGLAISTRWGGSGLGAAEVMLATRELGRVLGGGAFISGAILAGGLLERAGSEDQMKRWLPDLVHGRLRIAAALFEDGRRYDWRHCGTRATHSPDGYSISGSKTLVLHADGAQVFLVLARTSNDDRDAQGLSLFAVQAGTPGVDIQGFDTLDGRRAANVTFNGANVGADGLVGEPGGAAPHVEAALDAANAALCGEAVGAVEALISLTAEHLRNRVQFGSALAKFQALQHKVADQAAALELLDSMACAAAMAMAAETPVETRQRLVSAAKAMAAEVGRNAGAAAIQLHGGMGMTRECRVGHYAKRLLVIGKLFGDQSFHLERFRSLEKIHP